MTTSKSPTKVVFDCNVLLQAAANPDGPAAACFEYLRAGRLVLVVHSSLLDELKEVASRPKVARKLSLNGSIVQAFIDDFMPRSILLENVPKIFNHPFDAKDNIYIDVAIAAGAKVITSRDFHLLNLRNPKRAEGAAFISLFPDLEIITPIELLLRLRQT